MTESDQPGALDRFEAPARGDGFRDGLHFPDNQEDIAIGQPRDVVVWDLLLGVELEVPDEFAIPGELLNPATRLRKAEESFIRRDLGGRSR